MQEVAAQSTSVAVILVSLTTLQMVLGELAADDRPTPSFHLEGNVGQESV